MSAKDRKKSVDPLAFKKSDNLEISKVASVIERMFEAFGISVRVAEVRSFRYYIQYCLEMEFGTSVEDILKREKDLALYLTSPTGKVKIIAPIPNSSFIGINLPRRKKGQEEYVSPSVDPDHTTLENERNYLKEISNVEIEALIDEGIHMLKSKKYVIVSAPLFQRTLIIDEEKSKIVFGELQKLNIIINIRVNPEDGDVIIGDVDINELRKIVAN